MEEIEGYGPHICSDCGEIKLGRYEDLDDLEMCRCDACGLIVCERHLKKTDFLYEDYNSDRNRHDLGDKCPFCNLELIDNDLCLDYLLKINKTTKKKLTKELKKEFANARELKDFVYRNKMPKKK